MSYFKQITRRSRPAHGGRSQEIPLLHPPHLLFSPETVTQPLEMPNNTLGITGNGVLDVSSPPSSLSRTESIPSGTSPLPPTAQDLLFPVLEPPVIKESEIQRKQDSSIKNTLTPSKESLFVTSPETHSFSPLPSSVPSPSKVFKAAPGKQVLQGQIDPVAPHQFSSSSHPQLSDSAVNLQPAIEAPKAPVSQTTVSASKGRPSRIEPTTQALHTVLEPISSTRRQPAEKIEALGSTQLTQALQMPGNSGITSSQKPSIHIGTIDIQITPSPEMPKPVAKRSPKSGSGQLSRGFASSFGLRQG